MSQPDEVTVILIYDSKDELIGVQAASTFSEAEEMSDTIMDAHDDVTTIRVITTVLGKVFNERTLH